MAYPRTLPKIAWGRPGRFQGVTVTYEIDGRLHSWRINSDGVVTQAMAADLLEVSLMAVNNWVRSGVLPAIKPPGHPSVIRLADIKKVRKVLREHGRLRRSAWGT